MTMTRVTRRLSSILAAALAAGSFVGFDLAARAQDAPAGNVDSGKRIYLALGCFTCHGRSGQGGAYNGPAPVLAKTALPFEGFKAYVRAPARDMPGYSEAVMSDQNLSDIYAFVQSLPGRGDPKGIAILND
jgi:mono/diheme cytochrome c family protein